jgi:Ca2+-binding RTX toxin-like protein
MVYYLEETAGVVVNLVTGKGGGAAAGDAFDSIEWVFGSAFGDTIIGNGGDNLLLTSDGADKVSGGGGNDRISAGEGADTLNGDGGDDFLNPGDDSDPDAVIGGSGVDWVVYDDTLADITVNLALGTGAGGAAGDTYSGVENVAGGDGNDMLRPAAGGMAYGSGGDDIVTDWTGTEVVRGGTGNDTLTDMLFGVDDGVKDIFFLEFLGSLAGFDTVAGFNQGTDLFWLSDDGGRGSGGFPELAHNAQGNLLAGRVVNDNDMNGVGNATQNYAQLIFEKDTKFLWYDYDGMGGEAAFKIAQIAGLNSDLTTGDFKVVAEPMSVFGDGILVV